VLWEEKLEYGLVNGVWSPAELGEAASEGDRILTKSGSEVATKSARLKRPSDDSMLTLSAIVNARIGLIHGFLDMANG
jgi:hypothetical protein